MVSAAVNGRVVALLTAVITPAANDPLLPRNRWIPIATDARLSQWECFNGADLPAKPISIGAG